METEGNKSKSNIINSDGWNKSKYNQSYCNKAVEFLSSGKSMFQLAMHIGVSRRTIANWASSHPEFGEALEMGKDYAMAIWEEKLEETVIVDGVANPQLMKFLFYTRFGVSEKKDAAQLEAPKPYKPLSLKEFYANRNKTNA